MKEINLVLIFSLVQAICLGQTEMLNSQYLFEKTFITPANFQQDEDLRVFMNYQSSSGSGRGGKEFMYSAAANYKAKNDVNLFGVNVVNSQFGEENSLVGYLNYTYNLQLSDNAVLSNGIGMGIQQYRLKISEAQSGTGIDPSITGNVFSSKFDFRMGLAATINQRTYFGLSFDNILSNYNNQSKRDVDYMPASFRRINMSLLAGNTTSIEDDLAVHYEGVFTNNFGGVSNLDLNARVIFNKVVSAGLAYRKYMRSEENESLSYGVLRPFFSLDLLKNSNKFRFNYAYGFAPNKANTVGLSTHEFGFVYSFRK